MDFCELDLVIEGDFCFLTVAGLVSNFLVQVLLAWILALTSSFVTLYCAALGGDSSGNSLRIVSLAAADVLNWSRI